MKKKTAFYFCTGHNVQTTRPDRVRTYSGITSGRCTCTFHTSDVSPRRPTGPQSHTVGSLLEPLKTFLLKSEENEPILLETNVNNPDTDSNYVTTILRSFLTNRDKTTPLSPILSHTLNVRSGPGVQGQGSPVAYYVWCHKNFRPHPLLLKRKGGYLK